MSDSNKLSAQSEPVKKFNRFYICLIAAIGAVLVAALVLGVHVNLMLGLFVGIAGAVLYPLLLADEMKKSLGLWCRRIEGGIACSVISSKRLEGRTEKEVPERLMWLDVVALCPPEKKDKADTRTEVLYLPRTLKKIEQGSLSGMTALRLITYGGTAAEWSQIELDEELPAIEIEFKEQETDERV